MTILDELAERGLLQDTTDRAELTKSLSEGSIGVYAGYDPTASSLHIGNLIPTTILARLQKAGHRPIVLVGGATGMIGDPSGKSEERNLLDDETLAQNVLAARTQLGRLLDFDKGPAQATLVNNLDWFKGIGFIECLRDVGKHLSVNVMMAKESVKNRLNDPDKGISFTEFSYMLLQAYDFVHLAKHHDCRMQVGGSDQWGNITTGIDLARRMGHPKKLHGLVAPLLLDSQGAKMGKTSSGERVWLDPKLTSPYAFYQYWLNQADADVEALLLRFSWRPISEIKEIVAAHQEAPHKREGQKILAEDVVRWVHDDDALTRAKAASAVMFGGSLDDLSDDDLIPLLSDLPSSDCEAGRFEQGVPLVELLVETSLAQSKGAARRLVKGGGVYVNNIRVSDEEKVLTMSDMGTETMVLLRSGKKKYHILRRV